MEQELTLNASTKRGLKRFSQFFSNEFISQFYSQLNQDRDIKVIIDRLTADEFVRLKIRQREHLLHLADPNIDNNQLHDAAARVGHVHGMIGLTIGVLFRAHKLQTNLIIAGVTHHFRQQPERDKVRIFIHHRLLEDLVTQMTAMQSITQQQNATFARISQAFHEREPVSDLIGSVLTELSGLEGMKTVALIRPDNTNRFQIERYVGHLATHFYNGDETTFCPVITLDNPIEEENAMVRAWTLGQAVVTDNFALQVLPGRWNQILIQEEVRSGVILPLQNPKGDVYALLQMYHSAPGYFSGPERDMFLSRLQELLGSVTSQSLQNHPIISYPQRQAYRGLLEGTGLVMYYQPVVNLKTQTVSKMEALARLQDPKGNIVAPSEFLPTFGSHELLKLFTKGLYQALQTLNRWRAYAPIAVSVNLPPSAIGQSAYMKEIERLLRVTHTDPSWLTLELLETEHGSPDLAQGVAELSKLGVQVAQDDLGAGYSSLLRMGQVQFDEVKIDQGLVSDTALSPRRALEFVHHLTDLGHDFRSTVTIEGIEHAGWLEAATILGADFAQGYWIARPMPEEKLVPWIKEFRWNLDYSQPKTALGTFASTLLWHAQLKALTQSPTLLIQFVQASCPLAPYIEAQGLRGTFLDHLHEMMHTAAQHGIHHPQYHQIRNDIEQVLEKRIVWERKGSLT